LLVLGYFLINAGLANESRITTNTVAIEASSDIESKHIIEKWMTNLNEWRAKEVKDYKTSSNSHSYSEYENLNNEEDIRLEDWMLEANDSLWTLDEEENLKVDEEDEISLENWMLNISEWNN
jgi:hypothetical protein